MRLQALILSLGIAFSLAIPAPATADVVKLREDAPDRHVVVKGDTLWDISAKFLKSPWLWPELWRANDDHIKNPHLIYPGDVVYLVMTPDGPRLMKMETVKLSPTVRAEPMAKGDAIPPIPYAAVQAFLHRPLLADADAIAKGPKLVASEDGRNLNGIGDRVYGEGVSGDTGKWNIVRVGKPLKEPATGEVIGYEVAYIGDARTLAKGSPATLEITSVDREAQVGDHLIPAVLEDKLDFVPHAPAKAFAGQVISVVGNNQISGRYATVIINKGKRDGVESGHVLAVTHTGKTLGLKRSFAPNAGYLDGFAERGSSATLAEFNESDIQPAADAADKLPDVRTGLVMVYRVFDRVAYALVMESYKPIYPLDQVGNP